MYICNIKDFPNVPLYECSYDEYVSLIKDGFPLVYRDKGSYFFILDNKLKQKLKLGVKAKNEP